MRRGTPVAVLGVVTAAVLVAGCSTEIAGSGQRVGALPTPAGPSDPGNATGSPTGGSSDSSSSDLPPARTSLSCAPTVVTSSGAPFCYTLPAGFELGHGVDYPTAANFKTSVTPTGAAATERDLIEVLGYTGDDTDSEDDDVLKDEVGAELAPGRADIVKASPVVTTPVDGARGYTSTVQYQDGVVSTITIIFRGTTSVSVACQSKATASSITTGCSAVRRSLQLLDR